MATGAYAQDVQSQLNELKKQVEELQYKSYESIFTFSGRMENIYQHLTVQENKKGDEGTANYDYLSSLFQLNMTAIPSDRLSFYGRLSMSKYWNDVNPVNRQHIWDTHAFSCPNASSLFDDRSCTVFFS